MTIFKSKLFWLVAIILLIVVVIVARGGDEGPQYEYVTLELTDVIQEVSVTGTVKSAQDAELSFEKSGRIVYVGSDVGEHVEEDEILVRIDRGEVLASLDEARATVRAEEARLSELEKGTRPEEIAVSEVKLSNANSAMNESEKALFDAIRDAFTKSDDTLRKNLDQFFRGPRTFSPTLIVDTFDASLKAELEVSRSDLERTMIGWESRIDTLSLSSDLDENTFATKSNLDQLKRFTERMAIMVSELKASPTQSQSVIDAYKADITTSRSSINTAISNMTIAEEKVDSARSAVALAEEELALLVAGSRPETISAQRAKVDQAEATVSGLLAQLSKHTILSPFMGVVTKMDAQIGEIATAGNTVVTVIADSEYEIELNVPEADIAKVRVGNKARVTLDAYRDGTEFMATVTQIEPAETEIEGVATYKTTLVFDEPDDRVRSGMTANTDILTGTISGVIAVPQRSVTTRNGSKTVSLLVGDEVREVEIVTGLRGSDGLTEVVRGLSVGDKVITKFIE